MLDFSVIGRICQLKLCPFVKIVIALSVSTTFFSFVNGFQLAASKVKWNKGSAEVARGARSSSRLALQETVQRNSPVLQPGPTAVMDGNNNTGKIAVSVLVILVAKCSCCRLL